MRYKVKIKDRWFEVEITSLHTRPIIVTVEGETFEVWPATEPPAQSVMTSTTISAPTKGEMTARPAPTPSSPSPAPTTGDTGAKAVYAPIPGVIVSIVVQPGDEVTVGQELCVLEAMKMKNAIRASLAGEIASVRVSVGQHVKHHQVLIEYA